VTGVLTVAAGVLLVRGIRGRATIGDLTLALAVGACIAAYTLVDGSGARASGNAASYVSWLLFLEGLPFVIWVVARRGPPAARCQGSRRCCRSR
jgi:hypothetical protein